MINRWRGAGTGRIRSPHADSLPGTALAGRRTPRLACAALAATLAAAGLIAWPASRASAEVALLSQEAALSQLAAADIPWWSSGNCSDRYNPECTSFEGIRQSTIDGIITLKNASGCSILITGGTETGHGTGTYTHWNGWKVDISRWDCVSGYIEAHFEYVGYISGWGHQYRAPSGNLYTDEGNHWDILYYTCGGCEPAAAPVIPPSTAPASPTPVVSPSPAESPATSPAASPSPAAVETPTPPAAIRPSTPQTFVPQPSGAIQPVQPPQDRAEPEPSGPPIIDPDRIPHHRG